MNRKPIQTLVNLAQARQNVALKHMGALLAECRSQEERLGLLEAYELDYRTRLAQLWRQGAPAPTLANYRRFVDEIERVRAQQQGAVTGSRSRADGGRERWQDALRELRCFETLLERRTDAARVVDARRERAREDEIASQHAGAGLHNK